MRFVDSYEFKKDDKVAVRYDGISKKESGIVYQFDNFFESLNGNTNLNRFVISRAAYFNKVDHYCKYINFFIKFYDPDKEYLTNLIKIKYQVDSNLLSYPINSFISDVIEYILSDSMIDKINSMVEDEYAIDLSADGSIDEGVDLHALQFTNEHAKSIYAISVACKLTLPILSHYYKVRQHEMIKAAKTLGKKELSIPSYFYAIFLKYFPLFQKDVQLVNKLYVTATLYMNRQDTGMVERAENKAITKHIQINNSLMTIITELLPKYDFNQNAIKMNHVAFPSIIYNAMNAKDPHVYYEVSMNSSGDEMSGLDTLESNAIKTSDLDFMLNKINIETVIKSLIKRHGLDITKDEIKFYKKNMKFNYFFPKILQFFSSEFGGYYDLRSISKTDFVKLVIIFKHVMTEMGFRYIQHLFTGNLSTKISGRRITSKQMEKIERSPRYQRILKEYSFTIDDPNKNHILDTIAVMFNTPLQYIDYHNVKHNGKDIEIEPDIVADEYLRFIGLE